MNTVRLIRKLGLGVLLAGLCAGTAVLADNTLPSIKIEASVINKKIISMSRTGLPTEEVTVTRRVGYSDLDLKTHLGTLALKRRVEQAARLACKQIDALYPLERREAPSCIRQAIAGANAQVEEAIAAAHRNSGS